MDKNGRQVSWDQLEERRHSCRRPPTAPEAQTHLARWRERCNHPGRFGASHVVFDGDRNIAAPWRTGCAADKRMTQVAFDQLGHERYSALVAIVLKNREQVEPNENLSPLCVMLGSSMVAFVAFSFHSRQAPPGSRGRHRPGSSGRFRSACRNGRTVERSANPHPAAHRPGGRRPLVLWGP